MRDLQRGQTATNVSFLQYLRDSTAAQHARLEALPLSKMLLDEKIQPTNYVLYLLCMKDVVDFYENSVQPQVADIVPHVSSRKRLSSLNEDLRCLMRDGIRADKIATLQTPAIPTKAFALGMAYVIEGSTLGGRVIMKHIEARLNLTETRGIMFFSGYGSETGTKWKQFLEAMTKFVNEEGCELQVVEGAIAAFGMIAEHFLKNSTELNEN